MANANDIPLLASPLLTDKAFVVRGSAAGAEHLAALSSVLALFKSNISAADIGALTQAEADSLYQPGSAALDTLSAAAIDSFGVGLLSRSDAAAVRSYIGAAASAGTVNGLTSVADIAALKAVDITTLTTGQPIYITANGSVFQYNSSSTATANDKNVVQPTTGSGRYLHVQPRYNTSLTGTAGIDAGADETIVLKKYYDASTPAGLSYAGSGYTSHIYMGQNATASGTQVGVYSNVQLYAVNGGTGGTSRTEAAAFAGFVNAVAGQSNAGQNIWGLDITVNGPQFGSTTASREQSLMAGSFFIAKYTTGNALDSTHDGAYGVSIVTRPGSGGNSGTRTGQTTYPVLAGVRVAGVSGAVGTVGNGTDSGATDGFTYGVYVGGVGGSAWLQYNGRSRIGEGVRIEDYTVAAIHILNKLGTSFGVIQANNQGYNGLWTETPGRILELGAPVSQFENSIKINPTAYVGSKRAGIEFDTWVIGQDMAGDGTKNFFFYDSVSGQTRAICSASGAWVFHGAASVSPLAFVHIVTDNTQFPVGLYVAPSTHATSRRAGISLDGWTVGQDSAGNGTKDFLIYDGNTSNVRIKITTAGVLNIVGSGLLTASPNGGTADVIRFGQLVSAAVTFKTTQYIQADVNGTTVRLALCN